MLACVSARAQTTPLESYNALSGYGQITTDGLTFQISSCTYTAQGSSSGTPCNPGAIGNLPAGDVLAAVVNGSAAEFEVINTNASAAVLSLTSNTSLSPLNKADISLVLNVTPATTGSKTTVTSISTAVIGAATSSGGTAIPGELTKISAGVSWTGGATGSEQPNASIGAVSQSFAATNSLTVSYNIALNANMGTNQGDILILSNVSSIFAPAPEPATMLILGPAALLVGRLRKLRTRSRRIV
jgi:hypothetical protein